MVGGLEWQPFRTRLILFASNIHSKDDECNECIHYPTVERSNNFLCIKELEYALLAKPSRVCKSKARLIFATVLNDISSYLVQKTEEQLIVSVFFNPNKFLG